MTRLQSLTAPHISRRTLLRGLFMGLGTVAAPAWMRAHAMDGMVPSELPIPSGPLADIPDVVAQTPTSGGIDGIDEQVFAPPGFDVRVVARQGLNPVSGQPDPDGYEWHIDPDGGAVFPSKADGGWVYVSNSEETPGGVGALRFDAEGNLIDAYSILEDTRNNCAGGATPWGTWLSCEETGNGEVWECDPFGSPDTAVKKPALGAFPHEAAAIDPNNHVCYLTEDGGSNRFWRFVSDAADLTSTADGTPRMRLEQGRLQVLNIDGFDNGGDPAASDLREPVSCSWVDVVVPPPIPGAPQNFPTSTNSGTRFAQAEGIWYHEIPLALRATPAAGTVPTRGVMFFATKGDNRVYAYDIDNQLIELIYDNDNMQLETGFDQVDNVVVSPAGDVLVAEDGSRMRLVVVVPNKPAKLLMQITRGGSEITGPAFTPDGSRLYFSSQRGPSGADGSGNDGVTFEMHIPEQYRQRASDTPDEPDTPDDGGGDGNGGTDSGDGGTDPGGGSGTDNGADTPGDAPTDGDGAAVTDGSTPAAPADSVFNAGSGSLGAASLAGLGAAAAARSRRRPTDPEAD